MGRLFSGSGRARGAALLLALIVAVGFHGRDLSDHKRTLSVPTGPVDDPIDEAWPARGQ